MDDLRQSIRQVLVRAENEAASFDERDASRDFLRKVLATAGPGLEQLTGQFSNPKSRIGLALYCTLFQLAEAVHDLSAEGPSIAVPTLSRQAIDAYVDLKNLLERESYWKHLEAADDRSWADQLSIASANKNPFLKAIGDSGQLLEEGRREHKDRIEDWRKQGIKPLDAQTRFELAGMKAEYESLWKILSAYVHNGLSPLYSRHFHFEPPEPPRELHLRPTHIPYELPAISFLGELLLAATEMVHREFGDPKIDLAHLVAEHKSLSDRIQSRGS